MQVNSAVSYGQLIGNARSISLGLWEDRMIVRIYPVLSCTILLFFLQKSDLACSCIVPGVERSPSFGLRPLAGTDRSPWMRISAADRNMEDATDGKRVMTWGFFVWRVGGEEVVINSQMTGAIFSYINRLRPSGRQWWTTNTILK